MDSRHREPGCGETGTGQRTHSDRNRRRHRCGRSGNEERRAHPGHIDFRARSQPGGGRPPACARNRRSRQRDYASPGLCCTLQYGFQKRRLVVTSSFRARHSHPTMRSAT
jgi:hypothetical protein